MKNRHSIGGRKTRVVILFFGFVAFEVFAQGSFQNLDFELATVGTNPTPRTVSFASAFPGWTGYYSSTNAAPTAQYDLFAFGSSAFAVIDENAPFALSIAHYTALLQAGNGGSQFDVSLAQTGLIPSGTMSLHFLANDDFRGGMIATLNGQPLQTTVLQSSDNYSEYAADISAFAGHTAEWRFTRPGLPGGAQLALDNISFSPVAIPEPSTWVLFGLGSALFWSVARRKRKSIR